jgi:DNA-binding NtrC family response regulator
MVEQRNRVLVVDDEAKLRRILVRLLTEAGYEAREVDTGEQSIAAAEEFEPDVVIMDQNLPGISGQEATEQIVGLIPAVKVLMLTAYGAIDLAVDAMRRGAHDYLTKPFDNEELLLRVARAMDSRRLAREIQTLRKALEERHSFDRFVGGSPALRAVLELARRVARTDVSVLVEGESGTGKELVESEFFGHETGSFTGAGGARTGRFVQASGGTLFLDEITEMPAELQAKLLRALEESVITPIGASAPLPVDVRVVAATNREARVAVSEGALREDLYHRLAVVSLRLPPLREHTADIGLLARHFLARANAEMGRRRQLSPEALSLLEAYQWPGNVRELANAMSSAAIMGDLDAIEVADLPASIQDAGAGLGPSDSGEPAAMGRTIAEAVGCLERRMIEEALTAERGNKTRAADRLGITRKTLAAKMSQFRLD